jgi:hypothetical protein
MWHTTAFSSEIERVDVPEKDQAEEGVIILGSQWIRRDWSFRRELKMGRGAETSFEGRPARLSHPKYLHRLHGQKSGMLKVDGKI